MGSTSTDGFSNSKRFKSSSTFADAFKCCSSVAWIILLALMTVAAFSAYITTTSFSLQFPLNGTYTGDVLEAQQEPIKRIQHVCRLIREGAYPKTPLTYDRTVSRIKAIVDNYHKVLYCQIAKTGTTSWLSMLKEIVNREKEDRRRWISQNSYPFSSRDNRKGRYGSLHEFGIHWIASGDKAHREIRDGLPDPRTDYFKFIQVRHPLERLASAYYDKMQGKKAKKIGRYIKEKLASMGLNVKKTDEVTIEEYLTYVALPDNELTHKKDVHWKTFTCHCDLCSINYDFVAHLENLDSDLNVILPHFNAEDLKRKFPKLNSNKGRSSSYQTFYHGLPSSVLKPVLDKYRADADMFGYTFDEYLEERDKYMLTSI